MSDSQSHISVISSLGILVSLSSLYFLNVPQSPTEPQPSSPIGCPHLFGAQITFPGLRSNLVQCEGFSRAFILTADILYSSLACCALFPLAWYMSLNLWKSCTAFQKGVIGGCHPSEESTYVIPVPQDKLVNTFELRQLFSKARNSRTNP